MTGAETGMDERRAAAWLSAWLLGARMVVPGPIAAQLRNGLFGSVPIFMGGILNSIAVAALAAWLHPRAAFLSWLAFEIVLGATRLGVLLHGRRAIAAGQAPPSLLAALLSCLWAASVGYGTVLTLAEGDWVLSTIMCLSASAMVCGVCLRNFGTPRLAATMVFLILAPIGVAAVLAGESILVIIGVQVPIYMATIFAAAFSLHRLLASRMIALDDLERSESHALWMAHHDALTGLPNRALLQARLDDMLLDLRRPKHGALLVLDVDNFKSINDTLGHDAGDALLCTFTARLRAALSERDLVARTGGDEFAVIVDARSEAEVEAAAERIFEQLREPFCHDGRLLECGASIGASFIPRDGRTRSEIMKAADIALYAAKASGRARMKFFESSMMAEVEQHQTMIASARQALQGDTIVPHYQPKVSLHTARIVGFEALLRWTDQQGLLRGPDVLRAAFEDPALGGPISDRMLDLVLTDMERWLREGVDFGHVAINVTASDFRGGGFAERLLARLKARQIPPSCIQIEVTETVFLGRGADFVGDALRHLSDQGIRIALDDFGTGYASLSHLNQFPVDLLKIDRSFIRQIGSSPDAEAISATVINLGHCLGLEVIAEGIETAAQEAHLARAGCDTGQGFLYSGALPAKEVPIALLRQDFRAGQARRA